MDEYIGTPIYFDLAALALVIFLFIAVLSKKIYRTNTSKAYILLIAFLFMAIVCDIISGFSKVFDITALRISMNFYYIFRNSILVTYLLYIIALCGLENILKKHKILLIIGCIPLIIILILIMLNPLTNMIFYFDYTNVDGTVSEYPIYHRNYGLYFLYVCTAIYLVVSIVVVIKCKKLFNIIELVSLLSLIPLTLISLIIQYFFPNIVIDLFASALGAVLISITIEKQSDKIDERLLVGTNSVFIKLIKKFYMFNEESNLVLLKFKNYYEIYDQFSYDDAIEYVRRILQTFEKKYKSLDKTIRFYYLEDGVFAIVFKNDEYRLKIAEDLNYTLVNYKLSRTKFVPETETLVLSIPDDFNTYIKLVNFIYNFKTRYTFNSKITVISEVKESNSFKIMTNIEELIDNGIKNNEFVVFYQPIYDVKQNKFFSAEALIRFINPEYGFVPPGMFIPYAEMTGKVIDIDQFVIEEVCKFIASDEFKETGLEYIEINLSMIDCVKKNLFIDIINTMEKYHVTPDQLNIEITESYDSKNEDIAKENISKLREYGIKFSLDDYGTGYSNVERFTVLPISYVKIDKSLVDSSEDEKLQKLLKNTFSLINNLNRKTIVEGIETKEQANRFIKFGCDYIQGYYYSRPLSHDDFVKFVKEKNNK